MKDENPRQMRTVQDTRTVYSILDIDLDYFNLMPDAGGRFRSLLLWAACPVSTVVEWHNQAFTLWRNRWRKTGIAPSHILHVDEHHDMFGAHRLANAGNFLYHAMTLWPNCRVHWQVQQAIDSPAMWLEEEVWKSLRRRFTYGSGRPIRWPRPDLVTVCTSPDFLLPELTEELMGVLAEFTTGKL